MTKTVPEPKAELLSAEDVQEDVASLTAALERGAERHAYSFLERPEIREMLNTLIASGMYANEEEAIETALRTLVTAVRR